MNINLENTETLDNWSSDAELRLLGDPEKLNPHHVPGSRPSVLVTIKQGWVNDQTGLNRINATIEQGWFGEHPQSDRNTVETKA